MDSYQRDLFKTLINKIHLENSSKVLNNGSITKLVIHDLSHRWSFYITLDALMPYTVFEKFDKGVKKLFNQESVSLIFRVKNSDVDTNTIKDYWPWVVKHCGLSTIMTQQLIQYGHLKIANNKVTLKTKNEALRDFLINGALVQIEDGYYQLGFPRFQIQILGGQTKLPTKIIDFPIKKNDNDVKLAKLAVEALDNDSHK